MARRGRRRTGARVSHHLARDWSRPRPYDFDPPGAVYKRQRSIFTGGDGGRYSPHAKRLPKRTVSRPRGIPVVRVPTTVLYAPKRSVARMPTRSYLPLMPSPIGPKWTYSMSTTLGDRKTEPVRRPRRVNECTRRSERREVLHAIGIAGKHGSAPGKRGTYKRTVASEFSCRGGT